MFKEVSYQIKLFYDSVQVGSYYFDFIKLHNCNSSLNTIGNTICAATTVTHTHDDKAVGKRNNHSDNSLALLFNSETLT